ncbi:methionyl-tRNA formyltransferase [Iocasia frigidifontis]|uniref:Methionyl-tRNA formyltransferase n=1 Tax=Iocasia fonsfrigidae TaxID=2682810 RepID=A0A8A7KI40_9FIRM|nr:methionyl-tRNA formyltransferase [Iocasia fonsfrigidae]QTL99735.1 methionyl-tRNA formyltransferase [Iocasia fonsfrigidae]
MKTVFIGTVESSYAALEELLRNNIDIDAIFTLDKNKYNSDFKRLKPLAENAGIKTYLIKNINNQENIERLKQIKPDFIFVIGISQIVKKQILKIPKYGCIGFHPSLLPKNRGRGVIPWTILREIKETGVTLFYLDEGMDSGDIIAQKKINIDERETARTLYDKVIKALKKVIRNNINDILQGNINLIKQDANKATYCAKRTPRDGIIDWNKSAYNIDKLIRATTKPYPGAYTYYKGKKLIIWSSELLNKDNHIAKHGQIVEIISGKGVKVKTGDGLLLIHEIEYLGKFMIASELFEFPGIKFDDLYDLYLQLKQINIT